MWSEGSDRFAHLITHHDRKQFEVFCYSHKVAEAIQGQCDVFRDISSLTDPQAADAIVQDKIDLLVDLSMHTPSNRLLLFARKPAPVQFTGFAYPSTSGLMTIDWRMSDKAIDSDNETADCYSEQTVRLPDSLFCFQPPAAAPPVGPLPATSNGFLTFGCPNDFAKVSSHTVALWAKVLKQVDRSHLLLRAPAGSSRDRTMSRFQEQGVEPTRIEFVDETGNDGLSAYNRIDLCLDAFPWNGCTSTFDALWMGVPVMTLSGQTGVSRIGTSILTNLELAQFVANSDERFVAMAVEAARDLSKLAELRAVLRQRVTSSPLGDAAGLTRKVEDAYRRAWNAWCQTQSNPSPVAASW